MTVVAPDLNGVVRCLWQFPMVPPSLNQWQNMHWAMRNRIKGEWEQHVWAFSKQSALPPNCAWVYAQAEIVFRKNAHRDLSNYEATLWKIFPDVLQRVGVLKDDTAKEMKTGPVVLLSDKNLAGYSQDKRLKGITRIAVIAKQPE